MVSYTKRDGVILKDNFYKKDHTLSLITLLNNSAYVQWRPEPTIWTMHKCEVRRRKTKAPVIIFKGTCHGVTFRYCIHEEDWEEY